MHMVITRDVTQPTKRFTQLSFILGQIEPVFLLIGRTLLTKWLQQKSYFRRRNSIHVFDVPYRPCHSPFKIFLSPCSYHLCDSQLFWPVLCPQGDMWHATGGLRTGMTTSFVQTVLMDITWQMGPRATTSRRLDTTKASTLVGLCPLMVRLFSKRRRRFDGQQHSVINVHKTLDVAVGSLTDVVQTLWRLNKWVSQPFVQRN